MSICSSCFVCLNVSLDVSLCMSVCLSACQERSALTRSSNFRLFSRVAERILIYSDIKKRRGKQKKTI